jgi:hypothetical protein
MDLNLDEFLVGYELVVMDDAPAEGLPRDATLIRAKCEASYMAFLSSTAGLTLNIERYERCATAGDTAAFQRDFDSCKALMQRKLTLSSRRQRMKVKDKVFWAWLYRFPLGGDVVTSVRMLLLRLLC